MMGTYGTRARGGPQHDPPRSTAMRRLNWKISVLCKPLMPEAAISVSDVPGHFLSLVCHPCTELLREEEAQQGYCCWMPGQAVAGRQGAGLGVYTSLGGSGRRPGSVTLSLGGAVA